MSYKDLEAELARWLELEQLAKTQQEAIQAQKDARKAKRKRPPLYRPEPPVRSLKLVTLLLSPAKPVPLHEWKGSTGDWAYQRTERQYQVDALATLIAELDAIKLARADGYVWHRTLSIEDVPEKNRSSI